MVRRIPIGRLLEARTNEVSLSVIGGPVYIVLLREREGRKKKRKIMSTDWEYCYRCITLKKHQNTSLLLDLKNPKLFFWKLFFMEAHCTHKQKQKQQWRPDLIIMRKDLVIMRSFLIISHYLIIMRQV